MVPVTGESGRDAGFGRSVIQSQDPVSLLLSVLLPPPHCTSAGSSCNSSPISIQGQVQPKRVKVFSRNSPRPHGLGMGKKRNLELNGERDWMLVKQTPIADCTAYLPAVGTLG